MSLNTHKRLDMASKRPTGNTFSSYLPGWSNLPGGIVFLILDELLELIDFVRFTLVCKEWHSLAKHYYHTTQRWGPNKVLPMLLIPSGFKEVHHDTTTNGKILQSSLYSISERRYYMNNLESPALPCGINSLVFGCSHGWLATVDENRWTIVLVNPLRKSVPPILLQPLNTTKRPVKVILSADPSSEWNSCVVVVEFHDHGYMSCLKLSEKQQRWRYFLVNTDPSDFIFHKSQLYLCNRCGAIRKIDDVINPVCLLCEILPPEFSGSSDSYLVESTRGDLWHVLRFRSNGTQSFKVFKVVVAEPGHRLVKVLVEVKSIGDEALFLGYNSVSVLASEISGCRPNSIYYQSDYGISIFNLEDERSTQHNIFWPWDVEPAFWVIPPFNSASLCQ